MTRGKDSERRLPVGGVAFVLTVGLLLGAVAVGVGVDPTAVSEGSPDGVTARPDRFCRRRR